MSMFQFTFISVCFHWHIFQIYIYLTQAIQRFSCGTNVAPSCFQFWKPFQTMCTLESMCRDQLRIAHCMFLIIMRLPGIAVFKSETAYPTTKTTSYPIRDPGGPIPYGRAIIREGKSGSPCIQPTFVWNSQLFVRKNGVDTFSPFCPVLG